MFFAPSSLMLSIWLYWMSVPVSLTTYGTSALYSAKFNVEISIIPYQMCLLPLNNADALIDILGTFLSQSAS